MTQNDTKKTLTSKQEEAAGLVAEDELTDEQIAEKLSIGRKTLHRWKQIPDFANRVKEITETVREAVLTKGIADRVNRVAALDDRWNRMKHVINERAVDPQMQDVAGGKTGLLVHQVKGIGKGEDFQVIDLYMVDAGLLKEMREHEKQTAQELGQWTEKQEISGSIDVTDARERIAGKLASMSARTQSSGDSSGTE